MQGRTIIRTLTISTFLLAGLFAGIASAGQIDPGLEARMNASAADELIQVVIRPVGTLLGSALKKQVTSQYATRAEQHTAAVQALQATANVTQPAILTAMALPYFDGRIYNAKGFWIDNVVTAEMTSSAIAELSRRPDIDEILAMPKIELVAPVPADATDVTDTQSPPNSIKAIRADSVWAMGYTGSGRLVASIDTGVEGKHSQLSPRWRGHNGYSLRESWFDPVYNDTVPRIYSGGGSTHGTQVMGIMVALFGPDTIGVCPDCQWISAAAIDIPCPTNPNAPCANLFEALQWVADPDGDPLTDHDVPDAVANPWGAMTKSPSDGCAITGIGCSDIFWNAIDNIEAAGAVMIFAAGNEGQCGAGTIRNPANRISSETNAFSVGMVDARTDIVNPPVDLLSSFGPSDCNGTTVKPELVAPGVNLRTTIPPNGFSSTAYGTSFSTPYVAAAVALLREYNPNATVDQIKQALLDGARDLGPAGPDNQYGHGILNVVAALRALPANAQPSVAVRKNYYIRPSPGQSAQVVLLLKNSGTAATGVSVSITSNDPRLSIQDGTASFANMPNVGDTAANHDDPFDVTASLADLQPGERLPITVTITAADGYTKTMQAAIQTGPVQNTDIYTHDAGNFEMTISPFGGFGLQIDNLNPRKGQDGYGPGYFYGGDATPSLFEGAFLLGQDASHVSDAARNASGSPDVDFLVDPGGRLDADEPGLCFPEETRAAFSDANAENSLGLFVEQRSWVSNAGDDDDYLTVEYTIWNRSGTTLAGIRAALFFDWDFPWTEQVATRDDGGFNAQRGVGWMNDSDQPRHRGLCVVSPMGTTSYRYFENLTEIYDGFTEAEKWQAMSEGFDQTVPIAGGDGSHLIATGPFTIKPDSAIKVAFAIIGAASESELITFAQAARARYAATAVSSDQSFLNFNAVEAGPDPDSKIVTLTNPSTCPASYDVTRGLSFAEISPMDGVVPADGSVQLAIRPQITGLPPGNYHDTLLVAVMDPSRTILQIAVSLEIDSGGSVSVNPGMLEFLWMVGQLPPDSQSVTIANATPAAVTVSVMDVPAYLSVSPMEGDIGASQALSLIVRLLTGGLSPGSYSDTLRISTSDPESPVLEVPVGLFVHDGGAVIVNPDFLLYNASVGGSDPDSQLITLENTTVQSVTFGIAEMPAFVTVDPSIGVIASDGITGIVVRAHVGNRPEGVFEDTLRITTSDPFYSAINVIVRLMIEQATGGLSVIPNPFNPAKGEHALLVLPKSATSGTVAKIFDIGGWLVRDFGGVASGSTSLEWDGRTGNDVIVANGVYICYVEAPGSGGYKQTFKIAVKKN